MQSTVRHLVGAGLGVVAIPVLLGLSWWSAREWQEFAARLNTERSLAYVLSLLLIGAVVGALCGGRVVSPLASVVSGAALLVLNLLTWLPVVLHVGGPFGMGSGIFRAVGFVPTTFVLSFVLLTASAFPSRWAGARSRQAPRPLPAQEVQRS